MDDREAKLKFNQLLDNLISARVKTTASLKALAVAEEEESRCYTLLQMAFGESKVSAEDIARKAAELMDPSDANRGGATMIRPG